MNLKAAPREDIKQKDIVSLWRSMLRIRRVEERIILLYPQQDMRCPVHLCIGQEAVPAGICHVLSPEDLVLSNHRAHGHYLAKGGNLKAMFAEMYGKAGGCCLGRGGSMHLLDLKANFLGSTPIVGGSIPVATGVAFAEKMQATGKTTVAFFGDAAVEEGVFHESLNFAALKNLSILFVCENNLYSVYTPLNQRQPRRDIAQLAAGHGIKTIRADGNDIFAVVAAAQKAQEYLAAGCGPVFLEFATYRWREHCGPNDDNDLGYRTPEEFLIKKMECPLERLKEYIVKEDILNAAQIQAMEEDIAVEIDEAVAFAKDSAYPAQDVSLEDVYSPSLPAIHTESPTRELTYSAAIREATDLLLASDPNIFLIGEGVPDPKGIFGTTVGLQKKYGAQRVMDMPVSESGMTGICIGAALRGMRPLMTHQRVDFSLFALDQIINNAAKWYFMFGKKASVPLVIRMIIGRGWGQGAQHSQNLASLFAHIPGLKVIMPAFACDAKGMLIAAVRDNNPVLCLEHRWLYNLKSFVPTESYTIPLGQAQVIRRGDDATVVASSHMVIEALKASQILEKENIHFDVVDLRTIKPLDYETIRVSLKKTGRLIVLDSGWPFAGIGSEIMARATEENFSDMKTAPRRVTLPDIPVPSAAALTKNFYPGFRQIVENILLSLGKEMTDIEQIVSRIPVEQTPHDVPDPTFTGPF